MTPFAAASSALTLVFLTFLFYGCAPDEGRGETGRTRSLASVGSGAVARDVRLCLLATRDVTGTETFALVVSGSSSDFPSAIVLPSGEELALTPNGDAAPSTRVELASAPQEGTYRLRWGQDEAFTTSAVVSGALPPYPEFIHPIDQGVWFADREPVRWTWSGSAGLFALRLRDPQGTLLLSAPDLSGREADLLDAPSGAATLELCASSGASGARVRWESCTQILVSVAQ